MKKLISFIFTFIIAMSMTSVMAEDEIGVILDGKKLEFDQNPVIKNDRTLVPFRGILEAMGATVDWNGDTKTVMAKRGDVEIKLVIDNKVMYKNNTAITLDVAPQVINDRTMVPARAVSESFSAKVGWDGKTKTVIISTDDIINKAVDYINNADEYHAVQTVSYILDSYEYKNVNELSFDNKNKILYEASIVHQNNVKIHENIFVANPDKGYSIQNGKVNEYQYNGNWKDMDFIGQENYFEFIEENDKYRIYKYSGTYELFYINKETAQIEKSIISKEDLNKESTGEKYTEDIVTLYYYKDGFSQQMWKKYDK